MLKGKFSRSLLQVCPDLMLYGIDQWKQLEPSQEPGAEHYRGHDMKLCEKSARIVEALFPGRFRIVKGDSAAMASNFQHASLDFAFIDAAHTTEETTRNIFAWMPKIRPGGMLTGHDWNWPSVEKALNDCLPNWNRCEEAVWTYQI